MRRAVNVPRIWDVMANLDDLLEYNPRVGFQVPRFQVMGVDMRVIESPHLDCVVLVRLMYEIKEDKSVLYWNIWVGNTPDYGIL